MGTQKLSRLLFVIAVFAGATVLLANAQNVFVSNLMTHSIWKYGPDGSTLSTAFGMPLTYPGGLAFQNGDLYVAYGFNETKVARISADGTVINPVFASGLPSSPSGLRFDSQGNLYVIHGGNIAKFSATGTLLNPNFITGFWSAWDLVFDATGNLYVSDSSNGAIAKYSATGQLLNSAYITGLSYPTGLSFDNLGNLYVVNYLQMEIRKYGPTGTVLDPHYITGLNYYPESLAFDQNGNLYIGSNGNGNISKYDSAGNLIATTFASGGAGAQYLAIQVPEPTSGMLLVLGLGMVLKRVGKRDENPARE